MLDPLFLRPSVPQSATGRRLGMHSCPYTNISASLVCNWCCDWKSVADWSLSWERFSGRFVDDTRQEVSRPSMAESAKWSGGHRRSVGRDDGHDCEAVRAGNFGWEDVVDRMWRLLQVSFHPGVQFVHFLRSFDTGACNTPAHRGARAAVLAHTSGNRKLATRLTCQLAQAWGRIPSDKGASKLQTTFNYYDYYYCLWCCFQFSLIALDASIVLVLIWW